MDEKRRAGSSRPTKNGADRVVRPYGGTRVLHMGEWSQWIIRIVGTVIGVGGTAWAIWMMRKYWRNTDPDTKRRRQETVMMPPAALAVVGALVIAFLGAVVALTKTEAALLTNTYLWFGVFDTVFRRRRCALLCVCVDGLSAWANRSRVGNFGVWNSVSVLHGIAVYRGGQGEAPKVLQVLVG